MGVYVKPMLYGASGLATERQNSYSARSSLYCVENPWEG